MVGINTGYTNAYSSPASVTSTPANFGPGQLRTEAEQAEGSQNRTRELAQNEAKTTGYTTAARGNNLNISV